MNVAVALDPPSAKAGPEHASFPYAGFYMHSAIQLTILHPVVIHIRKSSSTAGMAETKSEKEVFQ